MSIARALDSSGVIRKDMGEFVIVDFIGNLTKEKYITKFGNDNCMPSCTCYNWRRTGYPCKHFFLIFEKFPAWNWEALPHLYTQSPFLCLDDFKSNEENSNLVKGNCDSSDKQSETSSKGYYSESECFMEDDLSVQVPNILEEIPKSSRPPRFAGQICREILNDIRSLSFLIEDEENIWDDVKEKLEEVRSLPQLSTKTDSSIPLLPASNDSNKRKSNRKCNLLTLRKKRKTEKSRVGVAKEKKETQHQLLMF